LKISKIIGQHVYPEMEVGKLGFRPGIYMASCDELYITIKGKGGHGAMPHKNIDPILIGSHVVIALQQLISRVCDPKIPTVLSIGEFIGKGATNICPDEVTMQGTIRTFNEEWRADLHDKILLLVESTCKGMGASVDIEIIKGYPYLENNEKVTSLCIEKASDLLGVNQIEELDIRMTAEDFSYYSQILPACFYRLGVGNVEKGITSSVHSPTFDIDERALAIGAKTMAYLAVS
jgi:amidohydrolase